jgi:hypothetical protein
VNFGAGEIATSCQPRHRVDLRAVDGGNTGPREVRWVVAKTVHGGGRGHRAALLRSLVKALRSDLGERT